MYYSRNSFILRDCGFENIIQIPLEDAYLNSLYKDGKVRSIEIDQESYFGADSEFPCSADIAITVHRKRKIRMPFSADALMRFDHNIICSRLAALGFTNISAKPIKTSLVNRTMKNGAITRISINGQDDFKENAVFDYDVNITVFYKVAKTP